MAIMPSGSASHFTVAYMNKGRSERRLPCGANLRAGDPAELMGLYDLEHIEVTGGVGLINRVRQTMSTCSAFVFHFCPVIDSVPLMTGGALLQCTLGQW